MPVGHCHHYCTVVVYIHAVTVCSPLYHLDTLTVCRRCGRVRRSWVCTRAKRISPAQTSRSFTHGSAGNAKAARCVVVVCVCVWGGCPYVGPPAIGACKKKLGACMHNLGVAMWVSPVQVFFCIKRARPPGVFCWGWQFGSPKLDPDTLNRTASACLHLPACTVAMRAFNASYSRTTYCTAYMCDQHLWQSPTATAVLLPLLDH